MDDSTVARWKLQGIGRAELYLGQLKEVAKALMLSGREQMSFEKGEMKMKEDKSFLQMKVKPKGCGRVVTMEIDSY
jgi:hypothetical protein